LFHAFQEPHGTHKLNFLLVLASISGCDLLGDIFTEYLSDRSPYGDNGLSDPHKALLCNIEHLVLIDIVDVILLLRRFLMIFLLIIILSLIVFTLTVVFVKHLLKLVLFVLFLIILVDFRSCFALISGLKFFWGAGFGSCRVV
jgi:hypothetical protein